MGLSNKRRGKGSGREALLALDTFLIRMGKSKVSLHVFGHYEVAINLYKKSGYYVTDLVIPKNIDAK
ncbi:MAG: GNAT family N-acetyltransferase [Thermoplasmata archaeon]